MKSRPQQPHHLTVFPPWGGGGPGLPQGYCVSHSKPQNLSSGGERKGGRMPPKRQHAGGRSDYWATPPESTPAQV